MRIQECSAIVTGGASGLGNGTARVLAEAGAKVVIVDLPSSRGKEAAAELGGVFAPADVTDPDQVQAAVDAAQALAPLRITVNCAGIATAGRTVGREGALGLDGFERTIRINLIGTFNVTRLAALAMS
jgi:NAD(P)-dependent dehydrogenase (short-subunit alcohol dehydrogenase family)